MAPRRGGSGSSGGSSVSSCPDAFPSTPERVDFACDVTYLIVLLGIAIAMFVFRRRASGAGKKLLSMPYMGAVLFSFIAYVCSMIAVLLLACRTTGYYNIIGWSIAVGVFFNISQWLLLFVVVYTLNIKLRQQLGQVPMMLKIALLFIVGLMGVLTCVRIGLTSYANWMQVYGYSSYGYGYGSLSLTAVRHFITAYIILYLVSVLAAGALALMSIMSLRSRRSPAGDLIGWVIALFLSMGLWTILSVVLRASTVNDVDFAWETSAALSYVFNFGQALSFIFIICIAKHAAWNQSTTVTNPMAHLDTYAGVGEPQQYGNDGHPNGQAHYYQQVPPMAYNGGAHSIKP